MSKSHIANLAIVFLTLLLFVEKAYAYLDPGTGSILLQGLIAAVIGGLVSGRLYWQRIKSFFSRRKEDQNEQSTKDQ